MDPRRQTGVRIILLLLVGLLALAGCGGDDEPVTAGAGPGGTPLADEYVSVEVTAGGEPRPLVEGTEIRLRFDDDQLSASLGCNQLAGSFRIDGTRLVVDGLSSTEMGCDPALHEQDQWFADFLTSGVQLLTSGDELVINDGYTAIVLRDAEVAEPDLPLLGTTWEVEGFADGQDPGDSAMTFGVAEPGRVRFEDSGFVTGFDGCNQFGTGQAPGEPTDGLRYEVDGDQLTLSGTPVTTEVACPDLTEYVDRFWDVLTGTVTWSVDGDQLRLVGEDGRSVTFRAVEG